DKYGFFHSWTPDSKTRAKSPNYFAFCAHRFSGVRNALSAAARAKAGLSTVQECAGGACSKTLALRNGDSTHGGANARILENRTAGAGEPMSGGRTAWSELPDGSKVTAQKWFARLATPWTR